MLVPEHIKNLEKAIQGIASTDRAHLDRFREEVRALKERVRPIRPYSTTAVSLVSTDAGDNVIEFDPYLVIPVRVVDSYGKVLFLDVLSPFTDTAALSRRHLDKGVPRSPLGRLMKDLGVDSLWELSPMIPDPGTPPDKVNLGWVKVYRDLGEWASLYDYLTTHTFVSHTMVVRDGFLRSKIFAGNLFVRMWEKIEEAVLRIRKETGRKVFVVGVAKRSKVIDRYSLAMFLEGVLFQPGSCYVRVPREMERKVYRWGEYARGMDEQAEGQEEAKFVAGMLFLAKFGPGRFDPIWPVDVWIANARDEEEVFGHLLADAQVGFPRPYYPLCLQKAHEQARLSGLDMDILQNAVKKAIKDTLPPEKKEQVDAFCLMAAGKERRFRG
ncbi:hypothetical protein V3F56_03560 [Moorellaceae bacterium AZ2]